MLRLFAKKKGSGSYADSPVFSGGRASVKLLDQIGDDKGMLIYSVERDDGGIQIREDGRYRWMHFGSGSIQSAMDKENPELLVLEYMRRMFSFLIFKDNAEDLLLLGLGGGAMLRFINKELPQSNVTAIDIDADVIEVAEKQFGIPHNKKNTIKQSDALFYLECAAEKKFDVIFVDLFSGDTVPEEIYSEEFIENAANILHDNGMAIINILPVDVETFSVLIKRVRVEFNCRVLCLPVPEHDNVIIITFKEEVRFSAEYLRSMAVLLEERYHLQFSRYLTDIFSYNRNSSVINYTE
ncbi:MAG: methyltransferase domain-containing protein [Gammaproteobacteria bacterium]|nr:MAG: methyltransferase domain-containing protein [Gammaproteobacteria bacterium]